MAYLTEEDFRLGASLTERELYWSGRGRVVLSDQAKFHGDIVGRAPLIAQAAAGRTRRRPGVRRNGVRLDADKWPGARIPYIISSRYSPLPSRLPLL